MQSPRKPNECLTTRILSCLLITFFVLWLIIVLKTNSPAEPVNCKAATTVAPKAPLFRAPPHVNVVIHRPLNSYYDPSSIALGHVYSIKYYMVKSESIFEGDKDFWEISDVHIQRIV